MPNKRAAQQQSVSRSISLCSSNDVSGVTPGGVVDSLADSTACSPEREELLGMVGFYKWMISKALMHTGYWKISCFHMTDDKNMHLLCPLNYYWTIFYALLCWKMLLTPAKHWVHENKSAKPHEHRVTVREHMLSFAFWTWSLITFSWYNMSSPIISPPSHQVRETPDTLLLALINTSDFIFYS